MKEELLQQIAWWVAGAVAALWGGSKVPWKALIAKLLGGLKPSPAVSVAETADASGDVHAAIYVLRSNITDAEGQKLVDAVDSYWWASKVKK